MWYISFVGDITLSDTIEFTSIDGDQFILTCISTGGPATTVTWTRDSVTITEGTETTLDNNITAQYTHTLTMTGRLGRLYTCTVANNKPSSDSSNLRVKGKDNMCTHHTTQASLNFSMYMSVPSVGFQYFFHVYYIAHAQLHQLLIVYH